MNKNFVSLIALVIGLGGCSSRPQFPWSLEGKAIPTFTIANREDVSFTGSVIYSLSVVVSDTVSKEELTLVSQKIIGDLPQHSLVTIFYYSDPKHVEGDFTVGKAWWGVDDEKNFPVPGDYSHHVLKVERKSKSG